MSENPRPNKNRYTYKYVQFTVPSSKKRLIKRFAHKENFKTISESSIN